VVFWTEIIVLDSRKEPDVLLNEVISVLNGTASPNSFKKNRQLLEESFKIETRLLFVLGIHLCISLLSHQQQIIRNQGVKAKTGSIFMTNH
jgi:hypothetical protein